MNPLNLCRSCERDFASLAAFDDHWPSVNSRTCLDVSMLDEWIQNARGRWTTTTLAKRAEQMRDRFSESRSEA